MFAKIEVVRVVASCGSNILVWRGNPSEVQGAGVSHGPFGDPSLIFGKARGHGRKNLSELSFLKTMAPRLSKTQRKVLEAVIIGKLEVKEVIEDTEIATTVVSCSTRTIRNARSNILRHGTIDDPCDATCRPTEITENM